MRYLDLLDLKELKEERKNLRIRKTKKIEKLEQICKDAATKDADALAEEIFLLEKIDAELKDIDERVYKTMSDQEAVSRDDLLAEQKASYKIELEIETALFKSRRTLERLEENGSDGSSSGSGSHGSHGSSRSKSGFRYKVDDLPSFSGDFSKFPEWWSVFKVVHDEPAHVLPKIKKFIILKGCLKGQAAEFLSSRRCTEDNYDTTIKELKLHFGNPMHQVCLFARMLYLAEKAELTEHSLQSLVSKFETSMRELLLCVQEADEIGTKLCDSCAKCDSCEKVLKERSNNMVNLLLSPLLLEKLPGEIVTLWKRNCDKPLDVFNQENLIKFVKKEAMNIANITNVAIPAKTEGKKELAVGDKTKTSRVPTFSGFSTNAEVRKGVCVFCGNSHFSAQCPTAMMELSQAERFKKVKDGRLCFNCLGKHNKVACAATKRCRQCGLKHHTFLHRDKTSVVPQQPPVCDKKEPIKVSSVRVVKEENPHASFMQTALVFIEGTNKNGERVKGRVFLDGGSDVSFVKSSVVEKIKSSPIAEVEAKVNTFGGRASLERFKVHELYLQGCHKQGRVKIRALEKETLCAPFKHRGRHALKFPHLQGLQLADTATDENVAVDILIGADFMYDILEDQKIRGKTGPVALESKFGWILHGWSGSPSGLVSPSEAKSFRISTEFDLQKFWDLDVVGVQNSSSELTLQEEMAMNTVKDKLRFVPEEGRYEVGLTWRINEKALLQPNREHSLRRLEGQLKKIQSNSVVGSQYREAMKVYEEHGFAEETSAGSGRWFMPHHAVLREDKATSKCRVVFDASSRTGNGISLNDALFAGPSLAKDVLDLLIRFRSRKIGLIGDIEKAFLQILVAEEDRDYLHYLWVYDDDVEVGGLKEMRMKTLPFGLSCSPFLLMYTLREHFKNMKRNAENEIVLQLLPEEMFVDDWISGANSVEDAKHLKQVGAEVMKKAGMNLRGFYSNAPEICDDQLEEKKVLGILWTKDDELLVVDPLINVPERMTKRKLLACVAKVYDPMGILGPGVLGGKLLMQELHLAKISWDEEVSPEILTRFRGWIEVFKAYASRGVPRYVGGSMNANGELHVFCDASKTSYAAVVYLLVRSAEEIKVCLLGSRTRVAPLGKDLTVPRLELMAMVIGSRFVLRIAQNMLLKVDGIIGWTDSRIALQWVKSEACTLKVFVANRVNELQTHNINWKWCPGSLNPADQASRGVAPSEEDLRLWFQGPEFLKEDRNTWAFADEDLTEEESLKVRKEVKKSEHIVTHVKMKEDSSIFEFERYGSFNRLLRVGAYVHRFIDNCKIPNKEGRFKGPLTLQEIRKAEEKIVLSIQKEEFAEEFNAIENGKVPHRLVSLRPCLDSNGMLMVTNRVGDHSILKGGKSAAILPKGHPYSRLVIANAHFHCGHQGVKATLNEVRRCYWILQGKSMVKMVLKDCRICRRHLARSYAQREIQLPAFRVTEKRPFSTSGVDYAGPMLVRQEGEDESYTKVWICLFTCPVVRAVFIDLVPNLTTEAFVRVFHRFNARRGPVEKMYSDNATTFKGASVVLAREANVQWIFIPDRTPHYGGWWERLIKSTKELLRRKLGRASLTFEELQTVLAVIESQMNNRPLTDMPTDNDEHFRVICPNDFISPVGPPKDEGNREFTVLSRRWRYRCAVAEQCWRVWREDYLHRLNVWGKFDKMGKRIVPQVGDVVLVDPEAKLNRNMWSLARVVKILPSRDNFPRVVDILMPNGSVLRRPTVKLYPLESSIEPVVDVRTQVSEDCEAENCTQPRGLIDWIQCDECDRWFHFKCVGLDQVNENEKYKCSFC